MSEISKTYEPQSVEMKWYQFWLDRNCFAADPARASEMRPAYSIVIPPPNVTDLKEIAGYTACCMFAA